ncbi:smoothelin-like protein 1 [Sciurus carolinensis]|uniref:smoothelin-like protein 1 n=1 Tax=Sciurus carolinensis TaxID=30640 RepID=UPI001FB34868|nr:smoothelin-like protein 1 [Sciurus carolinensis]XP_047372288.1 smoothelin-like protein 1 [Sciurus carolinensis]XP_047372289.1 smoothelin-like protein 1 [Sciurus carolinensis]XP_047372290.1 smoothelin-like protein 1 [Sciurus carolinensis]
MEQKEGKPSEDGVPASSTTGDPGTSGDGSAEEETKGTAGQTVKEEPPEGAEKQGKAPGEDGVPMECQGEANGLGEVEVESQGEASGKEEAKAQPEKEDEGKEKAIVASQEKTDRKEETKSEPKEAEVKEEDTQASETQKTDEKEAEPESKGKAEVRDEDKPEPKEAVGEEAANKETKTDSQKKPAEKDEAKAEPQEVDGKEEAEPEAKELVEPGDATAEQERNEEESQEGAAVIPSSPEEWPESPTKEGPELSPDGLGPDSAASGETSPSASESSPSDVPQSPTESPPSGEKKKEKAPERRVSVPTRPRGPRAQNRKAIVDKFGGAASGPTALFRNTKAAGAAIGGVKNMLLEWCRAMTRNYEHVDIQNFSSSWSSGMAFCALIHKFFPDAFDYAALDPTKRRHNFTLAFSTAEKLADCAQLLEVDDMVRLAVPDSKCVYTYIQELYRSLVQKGLVKTKKK